MWIHLGLDPDFDLDLGLGLELGSDLGVWDQESKISNLSGFVKSCFGSSSIR